MKLYSCDLRIYGTAYIKAKSKAEALTIARSLKMSCLEVRSTGGDIETSDEGFRTLEPDISLSTAMTIHGPDDCTDVEQVHNYGR